GGGTIGSSLGLALGSAGIKTAILDVVEDLAIETAKNIYKKTGTESLGIMADVLNKDYLLKTKERINNELGTIDYLINAAGGNSPKATTQLEILDKVTSENLEKSFYGLDIDGFRQVFDLNFMGTLLPTMVFTRDMVEKGNGAVVNFSSMSSYKPLTKVAAYSAAKSAINNFTEWLAVHLAKQNIRVNAVAPGFFVGKQNRFLLFDEKTGELTPRGKKILDNTPMGRFGEYEEIHGTILYLLSDLAKFITGVVIPVDGGFNAYSGV
ncbi:MAG: SDR family oxidoreductase, partial [Bacteroidales bacterium]|nr:SDR family oxidoreductase [Bacteroidales bacterium]